MEKDGVLLPPTAADIETALKKERDVTAVLITSPDYYGNVADLSAIEKVCRRYNRIFMVDGAHGAYLKFDADARGLYAGECAHIWVDGSHKTMPTLTQGALLNVNDESLLADAAEGLNMFRTTSPSYPIMASIEYGVKYMEENGAALIDAVRRELTLVKAKLRKAGIPFYAESKTLVLAVDFGAMGHFALPRGRGACAAGRVCGNVRRQVSSLLFFGAYVARAAADAGIQAPPHRAHALAEKHLRTARRVRLRRQKIQLSHSQFARARICAAG